MFDSPQIQAIISVIGAVKPVLTWVYSENMTENEKNDFPEHAITGGFLRKRDLEYCWQKSWEEFTQEQKDVILNAPNFDADIFKEITGIDVKEKSKKSVTLEVTEEQWDKIQKIIKE